MKKSIYISAVVVALLGLSGCGSDGCSGDECNNVSPTATATPTPTATATPTPTANPDVNGTEGEENETIIPSEFEGGTYLPY